MTKKQHNIFVIVLTSLNSLVHYARWNNSYEGLCNVLNTMIAYRIRLFNHLPYCKHARLRIDVDFPRHQN